MDHNPNIDPSPSPTNEWTENQEQLLVGWAEKASGYVWLHNRGTQYFKKRNRYISIPAVFFAYAAGSSAFLLTDEIDLFYIKAFIGCGQHHLWPLLHLPRDVHVQGRKRTPPHRRPPLLLLFPRHQLRNVHPRHQTHRPQPIHHPQTYRVRPYFRAVTRRTPCHHRRI